MLGLRLWGWGPSGSARGTVVVWGPSGSARGILRVGVRAKAQATFLCGCGGWAGVPGGAVVGWCSS